METLNRKEFRESNLYEEIADRISNLISSGAFRTGDRIPSVRKLSQELKVSITTVMQAYRLLENKKVIEARPQSGYFVRPKSFGFAQELGISKPSLVPTQVSIGELTTMVFRDMQNANLIQLGAAVPNPELLPTDKLNKALYTMARMHKNLSNVYDVPPGCKALRVQAVRRALTAGCTLSPDDIMTTSGCTEAINLALRAICRPGDTVAIESPVYYGFLQMIEVLGLRALEIPTHPRDGISLEALRFAIESNPVKACLLIPNFSNPLGSAMSDEKKKELVGMLNDREIPLIEDDVYGELCFSSERPKAAKAYDKKDLVIFCSSVSKILATGYRVGWMTPGRFKKEIIRLKITSNAATATLPQLAVADFLANGGYDHHLRKVRRVYASQVAEMAQAVVKFFPKGTKVTQPTGGYVLWVEFPSYIDSLKLYELALKYGITIAPGPIFSAKGKYTNFIRLNAAFWSEKVEKALFSLGQLAEGMKRK